jgi:hypothetical protein
MNRNIMFATMALSLGIALPGAAIAQTAKDLVGTWTNVSNVNIRQDGSRANVFGPNGKGIAIFEANGRTKEYQRLWPGNFASRGAPVCV